MKKIFLLFIFIIAVIALPLTVLAGNGNKDSALGKKVAQWMSRGSGLRFIENKGQMMDMQRKPVNNVLYKASAGGVDVYITTSGLSYVFTKYNRYKKKSAIPYIDKRHQRDSITINYCRADMNLVGADILKENIIQEGESEDRTDYYYGDICPNGILNVHSYTKITIKNIYPGIDWVLHSSKHGLKYDFIVHPGANPSLIALSYKWTDQPQLQPDGSVKISTPMGTITEGMPVSYVANVPAYSAGFRKSNPHLSVESAGDQVQTVYTIKNNEIHFKISNYNTAETLTIDPQLVWATYYGNGSIQYELDDIFSMQEDGSNVWLAGFTFSFNFATYNPGGGTYFQGTAPGYGKIILLKFNINGVLRWATYYGGGPGYDWANSIYSDKRNVWVTGYAESTNFPTLNPGGGAYFQSALRGGGQNVFILQFDTAGVRKWATYYGGNQGDAGYSINSDGKNVWITGYTSSTNFPTLNPGGGAYFQGALAQANGNAFVLQFNTAGVRKWATYYGGNSSLSYYGDLGYSICSDGKSVWVTGLTISTSFPTFNPGGGTYFQGTIGGLENAFILRFDTMGVRKWATYYGGNDSLYGDIGYCINSDGKNVWVTGAVGSSNFPTLNPGNGAYFQGKLAAVFHGNVFILKFDTVGVRKWATYYGGSALNNGIGGEAGYDIQSDGTNVWVDGETTSTDFPTLNTGCGFNQDNIGRIQSMDAFILQFDTAGVRKWATYYGNDQEDDYSGIWSDGRNLFVAGDDNRGLTYPTVNPGGGAYYDDTTGFYFGNELIFIGKFIIGGGLTTGSIISICRGDSTILTVPSGATSYTWSPSTGLSATNIPNPVANPTVTTIYTVTGIDTSACTGTYRDSVKVIVDTFNSKNITLTRDTAICRGASITLNANGGANYTWSPPTGLSATNIPNPMASPTVTTTYTVTGIDTTICIGTYRDSVKVIVDTPSSKNITLTNDTSICNGSSIALNANGGANYTWRPPTGLSATNIPNPMASPTVTTTYTVTGIDTGACGGTAVDSVKVIVNPPPVATVCCDSIVGTGQSVQLISSGGHIYSWSPPAGLSCDTCPNPVATPDQTTTYTLTITNDSGCTAQGFVTIDVSCGEVFVPDAFSPNGSVNNILYVRCPCIATMDFMVFDRWGNKVFESQNQNNGWDGNHNGAPMNMGTYVWALTATLSNGTSIKKKGNVTLIR